MAHIRSTHGKGRSKKTLMDAIADAIGQAVGKARRNGDHKYSLLVRVDGYDFDGEEFGVRVSVSVVDYDEEHDELYRREAKELEEKRRHSVVLAAAFYASLYKKRYGQHPKKHRQKKQEQDKKPEQSEFLHEDDGHVETYLFASPDVHEILAREIARNKHQYHLNLNVPTLTLGAGSHSHKAEDEAA